jgi:hypothetical protein
LVASTKVLANYAGTPFIDKALPVVAACAKYGTCYTDITGEVPFQRVSYDRYVSVGADGPLCCLGMLIIRSLFCSFSCSSAVADITRRPKNQAP